jgi:hypothetical protein
MSWRLGCPAVLLLVLTPAASPLRAEEAPRTDLHGDPLPPGALARLGSVRLRPGEPRFTGGLLGRLPAAQNGRPTALTFSPDSRTLAVGALDGTTVLWDWAAALGLDAPPGRTPEQAWNDLAAGPLVARRAVALLAAEGKAAVALLKARLRPVQPEETEALRRLVRDLGGGESARPRAAEELLRRGADVELFLRRSLTGDLAPEVRARLKELLDEPRLRGWSADGLRRLRGVAVLERIGTPEARSLLRDLAGGDPDTSLTLEAQQAGRRLARD